MGDTSRPELLTVDEALALDVATITELSRRHLGSGQHRRMQLLAFDSMLAKHAKDMYYLDAHSREVLDFSGGFGALATGHNHPR
ncbi:MAG TPA: aspartate aminotransferase family protein, partial [Pseudonocardiaceae bacterium]